MGIEFDNSYAKLGSALSVPQPLQPVAKPQLIRLNDSLADYLGLDPAWLTSSEGLAMLAGNQMPEGATPVAAAYAGHQFGHFNPQLGDGRALLLGEVIASDGKRFDLQLKGSGPTAWSRGGDGRSPLGPVLREYLVSEAMAALGVPTTRALAAVSTGENVARESFLPGAILTRVASSHLRVGTLQYFAAKQDHQSLALIVEHALQRHYPQRFESLSTNDNQALVLLEQVIEAQAGLIARWQLLGFVHGVMNTDNMLLCGETVDYGPCAYMEGFDLNALFSSIDTQGRYAYSNQPAIAQWNLTRMAEALLPLINEDVDKAAEQATETLETFGDSFIKAYDTGMATKLGLAAFREGDGVMVSDLYKALEQDQADFTLAFRYIAETAVAASDETGSVSGLGAADLFEPGAALSDWLPIWRARLKKEPGTVAADKLLLASPAFIARNHQVHQAIHEAEIGNFDRFHRLAERLQRPAAYNAQDEDLALPAKPQERVLRTFCGT